MQFFFLLLFNALFNLLDRQVVLFSDLLQFCTVLLFLLFLLFSFFFFLLSLQLGKKITCFLTSSVEANLEIFKKLSHFSVLEV